MASKGRRLKKAGKTLPIGLELRAGARWPYGVGVQLVIPKVACARRALGVALEHPRERLIARIIKNRNDRS